MPWPWRVFASFLEQRLRDVATVIRLRPTDFLKNRLPIYRAILIISAVPVLANDYAVALGDWNHSLLL